MKKIKPMTLAVFCSVMLAFLLAGCGAETAPDSPGAESSKAIALSDDGSDHETGSVSMFDSLTIGGYPARQLDELDDLSVYYVEISTPESPSGNHPTALDSAKKLGTALLRSDVPNIAGGRNIYISFTGLESVKDADVHTFAVSLGSEFDPQDYANLFYLAVDYSGNIYSMPDDAGVWEPWNPAVEIDTGVFYVEGAVPEGDSGENPSALDSAKVAWDAMKKHGAPTGAPGRNIIFRFMGVETFADEDLYSYSVELDYGAGAEPIFRVGVNYSGDVFSDAGGDGWEPLPYGDMFGGQFAALP
ncbi:MAG: hypothetical protein VB084_11960 [Syntrophomonadaceae bacterium]|nr:hypothetical protein [Syntrophomonadaceae bacterium]